MKKITLVLFLLVCVVGFGQQTPSAEELLAPLSSTNATRVGTNNSSEAKLGTTQQQRNSLLLNSVPTTPEIEAELLAAANRSSFDVPMSSTSNNRSVLADIIPTAGATETFTPAVGDNFFDPGGPGGSSTGGTPGNYPNCGCITTTTLDGVTEIEFLFFSVFATFDWLVIYDSADTSGPELYNNASGGANEGDITLADMIASNGSASFVGTSGSLTFEFRSSTVVDYGGWDAEIIAAGPPPAFPAPYCGPLDFTSAVEPMTLVDVAGISNVTDATVGGTPAHEDFTLIVGAMEEGMSYPIALEGNTDGNFTNRFAVFIDWNQNEILDDAGEVYEILETIANSTGTDGQQATGTIVVPAGVTAGDTRMRVKKIFGTTNYLDPCLGTGFGQAEDYTITVTAAGGGGACSQDHPVSATVGGGSGSSVDSDFKTAADITVATGEDFTIDTIEANFLTFAPSDPPTTANVVYYEDAGGLPGTMIGSETVVPTIISSSPWANPVADQYLTSLALTPFTFSGDAGMDTKYWIEVSMGTATNQATVFWEYTPDTPVEGEAFARFDGTVGTWSIIDPTQEVIYNFSGECTPIMPPVDNDACMDAIAVACGDTVTGDTSDNTDQGGANTSPDEWFKFTGTGSPEIVTVSLCDGGTGYDSVISVYDSCGGTQVVVNDDSCGLQSEASFLSDGTTTYYIAVEGFGTNSGAFSLAVTCAPLAPNDLCENAIAISCGDSIMGTTNNSTIDDAVAPLCDTGVTSPGVWYVFDDTSGLASDVTITLCGGGTAYDSKLSVYTGDCGAPPLTCVVGNDDSCGLQSEVSFSSDGNTTFYVLVHGFGGQTGDFSLDITCDLIPPPNDLISNSIDIDEVGCPFTDPAVAMPAATTESGNPMGCDISGANGVWYNYTAPGDGFITGTIVTPAGASAITFYEAPNENAAVTDLVLVDYFQNQCVPGSTATIPVVSGQAYYAFVLNTGGVTDITFECDVLGTDENTIEGFAFYPNPADNTINFSSIDTIENVTLFNILGQEVVNRTIDATTAQIDVHNLASGTYIMKVSVNGELGTYKVIKR